MRVALTGTGRELFNTLITERFPKILSYPLKPVIILLNPEVGQGYWRDWQPSFGGFGPERHQGYAVQWFALSVALVILYVIAGIRREIPSALE